ncbi:hypothetical protein DSO06_06235 [Candidatus Nezhaarchaeota archaeon WYZ-LMO8]|nr:MAG: hypothetical protein DSO05_07070 [Candidatus Nezhaarchaeota archaeon WYZ-LMO7]TDA34126.1 MAG: hypothetical protein DSO06_06235 [Candidatus Nezhaarchaeota archaeon WYZ-LMO8]
MISVLDVRSFGEKCSKKLGESAKNQYRIDEFYWSKWKGEESQGYSMKFDKYSLKLRWIQRKRKLLKELSIMQKAPRED